MSYTRGDVYTWVGQTCDDPDCAVPDHEVMNLWTRKRTFDPAPYDFPSGVGIDMATFDELVVMRMAELIEDGHRADTIVRALRKHAGNVGSHALMRAAGIDPFGPVKSRSQTPADQLRSGRSVQSVRQQQQKQLRDEPPPPVENPVENLTPKPVPRPVVRRVPTPPRPVVEERPAAVPKKREVVSLMSLR